MTTGDVARGDRPGGRIVPALVGLGAGSVVHLLALVALGAAVLRSAASVASAGGVGSGFVFEVAAPGAIGLALACGVAARVCLWRCRAREVASAAARRTALLVGAGLGVALLGVGLVLALRWMTLPLYVVAAAAGTAVGGRRSRRDHAQA